MHFTFSIKVHGAAVKLCMEKTFYFILQKVLKEILILPALHTLHNGFIMKQLKLLKVLISVMEQISI